MEQHTEKVISTSQTNTPSTKDTYDRKKMIFRTHQVVWYIVGLLEALLGFRIILKALAANPFSGFTDFIYAVTDPFALPFAGIFRTTVTGGSVFEWSSIIAMIVYLLIAVGVVKLLQIVKPTNPTEVHQKLDHT